MNAPVRRQYGFSRTAILLGFAIIVALVALRVTPTIMRPALPEAMVLIPGGEFIMGTNNEMPHEGPAHRVQVDAFWIDETEVTNRQFKQFVEATGYLTTAERPVDWNQLTTQLEPGAEKPPDDKLAPGSVVFSPPQSGDTSEVLARWWE